MDKKNSIRTTKQQNQMLVELMEKNPEVACGRRTNQIEFWKEVAEKLNSIGPPFKEATSWSRVWIDKKYNAKRKLNDNKKEMNKTGGGIAKKALLDDLDERVLSVTHLDKNAIGVPGTISIGSPVNNGSNRCENIVVILEEEVGPSRYKATNIEDEVQSSQTNNSNDGEGAESSYKKKSNDREKAGSSITDGKKKSLTVIKKRSGTQQGDKKIDLLIRQNDLIINCLRELADSAKNHVEETKSFHFSVLEHLKKY